MIVIDFDGWAAREEPNGDYFRVWSRVRIYYSEVVNKEAELVLFFKKKSCLQNPHFFHCHVSCEGSGTSLLFSSLKSQRRRTNHSENCALTEQRSTAHQKEFEFPSSFRLSLWIYMQAVLYWVSQCVVSENTYAGSFCFHCWSFTSIYVTFGEFLTFSWPIFIYFLFFFTFKVEQW